MICNCNFSKKSLVFFSVFAYNIFAGRDALYTRAIELTFKRYVISPNTRSHLRVAFIILWDSLLVNAKKHFLCNFVCIGGIMNIYIYSDESGVFDKVHNDIFVFGGIIILGTEEKAVWSRKYSNVEKLLRKSKGVGKGYELKATRVTNKEKGKLFRSLNQCHKFGVVIDQTRVLDRIFEGKKDKQRYLDYAYKIAVKRAFEHLIADNIIIPEEVERLYFYVDEHTTATNGKYELKESLEQEFKHGTYNQQYSKYFPPIFPDLKDVQLSFCNSESTRLVRAADIVANRIYYLAGDRNNEVIRNISNLKLEYLP